MKAFKLTMGILIIAIFVLNTGCITHNKLLNYQFDKRDSTFLDFITPPELKIQSNDVLSIQVYSLDKETVEPFNIIPKGNFGSNRVEAYQLSGYLVDQLGIIDFPVVGAINVSGMTIPQAKEAIREKLLTYLRDPVVSVRVINFKVTVTGEVRNPGAFTILNERISVPDALALAGGLTDYANRREILLVREDRGTLTVNKLNIQEADFFSSKFYYLKQNDMLYIEPIKAKAGAVADNTSKVIPIITGLGTVVAIVFALFR